MGRTDCRGPFKAGLAGPNGRFKAGVALKVADLLSEWMSDSIMDTCNDLLLSMAGGESNDIKVGTICTGAGTFEIITDNWNIQQDVLADGDPYVRFKHEFMTEKEEWKAKRLNVLWPGVPCFKEMEDLASGSAEVWGSDCKHPVPKVIIA